MSELTDQHGASPPTSTPGSPPAAGPLSRQLLSRADRRASILRGAARAFARSGFAATSMEDVAVASSISRLIVYRHFDSKEELYRAVLERVSAALTAAWVREVARPEHGIGARVLLSVAREDPDGFALLWRHAAREASFADYAAQQRERSIGAALRLMSGHLRPEVDARWAASTVVATLVEAVLAWLEDGDSARDDQVVALMAGAVAGMIASWSDLAPT